MVHTAPKRLRARRAIDQPAGEGQCRSHEGPILSIRMEGRAAEGEVLDAPGCGEVNGDGPLKADPPSWGSSC